VTDLKDHDDDVKFRIDFSPQMAYGIRILMKEHKSPGNHL
jgi:hypothetical protein